MIYDIFTQLTPCLLHYENDFPIIYILVTTDVVGDNWCGRFRFVAVPVCGRFGLWPFRSVSVPVCVRSGLWPFRSVAVSVCGRSGLWPFQFVAVSVLWPLWPVTGAFPYHALSSLRPFHIHTIGERLHLSYRLHWNLEVGFYWKEYHKSINAKEQLMLNNGDQKTQHSGYGAFIVEWTEDMYI